MLLYQSSFPTRRSSDLAGLLAHCPDPRIVGVEHRPAAAPGDADDCALDLGQLVEGVDPLQAQVIGGYVGDHGDVVDCVRSEEHTSELQSPCNIVCRLQL